MIKTSWREEMGNSERLVRAKRGGWRRVMLVGVFLLSVVVTVVGIWFLTRQPKEEVGSVAVVDARGGKQSEPVERREKKFKRNIICEVRDVEAPELTLNGLERRTLILGSEYAEEGAVAEDNCDGFVNVATEGAVDVKVSGAYEVKYSAQDRAGNKNVKVREVRVVNPSAGERVVYLTFDDGPSEHTARLLDVLKKYGVKVTFFVTGYGDDALIKREFEEGHTVALHTNTHNYAYVYSSDAAYFEDLYAVRDRVLKITGVAPNLIRFPGGSSNTISAVYSKGIMSRLVTEVGARGFSYADWNVSSGDAGGASTADEVFNNVVSRFGDGQYVVLQHDTKGFSVDAVERIIQYGMENGYAFLPMDANSYLAHHGVNN